MNQKPTDLRPTKVTNVDSEEIPDEIILPLSKMKNGRTADEDGIIKEIIQLGRAASIYSMNVLLNKFEKRNNTRQLE